MTFNPLVEDIEGAMPPVEIALPTRGKFYDDEMFAPGANPDELTVHGISMLEENSFNDPVMMLSGRAVARMLNRVCPVILDPARLTEVDVNTLLIAARIASCGPDLDVNLSCAECKETTKAKINLDEHLLQFEPFTSEEFEQFELTLPVAKQRVHLMPLSYEDAVNMQLAVYRSERSLSSINEAEANNLSEDFVRMYGDVFDQSIQASIHTLAGSVHGVTTKSGKTVMDRDLIDEWIRKLPPRDLKAIQKRIKEIMERIRDRSRFDFICQNTECGHENSTFLEIDPQKLFTEAEESETETASSAASKSTGKNAKVLSRTSRK